MGNCRRGPAVGVAFCMRFIRPRCPQSPTRSASNNNDHGGVDDDHHGDLHVDIDDHAPNDDDAANDDHRRP
jgi:hypothetical protein